jgi:hypothetical protein
LFQIAKLDYANDLLLENEGGDGATRALLASYGRTPGATPLRTPARTPGGTGRRRAGLLFSPPGLLVFQRLDVQAIEGDNPFLAIEADNPFLAIELDFRV